MFGRLGTALSLVFALAALGVPVAASANLLSNGDFEDPAITAQTSESISSGTVTSWTWAGSGGSEYLQNGSDGSVDPQSGNQWISWGNSGYIGGSLAQSFITSSGTTYTVSYWLNDYVAVDAAQQVTVSVNNAGMTSQTANMPSGFGWTEHTFDFTATSLSTTLTFFDASSLSAGNDANWALDNVSVDATAAAIPEPGTMGILATALLGFGLIRRRTS